MSNLLPFNVFYMIFNKKKKFLKENH